MNTVVVSTEPPLLASGRDMAQWLVSRNPTLQALLTQLGLITEYGVNLRDLKRCVVESDEYFRATVLHHRAQVTEGNQDSAPRFPSDQVQMFSRMGPAARGRLRLIASFEGIDTDDMQIGVEWSFDEMDLFAAADPGLVADFATAIVARYVGV